MKWHAGQIINFSFASRGYLGKKPGIMLIFSNVLNCQSIVSHYFREEEQLVCTD